MKNRRDFLTIKQIEDLLLQLNDAYSQQYGESLTPTKEDVSLPVEEQQPIKWYHALLAPFRKAAEVAAPAGKVAQTGSQVGDDVPNALPSLIPKSISAIVSPFFLSGAGLFIFTLGMKDAIKDLLDDLKEITDPHKASNKQLQDLAAVEAQARGILTDKETAGSSSSAKKSKKFIFVSPEFINNPDFSQYANEDLERLQVKHPYKKVLKSVAVNSVFIIGNAVGLAASSILLTLAVTGVLGIITAVPAIVTTVLPMFIPSIVAALSSYGLVQTGLAYYKAHKKEKLAKKNLEAVYNEIDASNNAKGNLQETLKSKFNVYLKLKEATELYDQAAQEKFEARRELAYSAIETLVSVAVLAISTVVFAAALGALGGVSFGAIPSALILSIAGVGAAIKIFELVDDMKFEGRLSKKIDTVLVKATNKVKSGVSNAFGWIFGKKPAITADRDQEPGPGPSAGPSSSISRAEAKGKEPLFEEEEEKGSSYRPNQPNFSSENSEYFKRHPEVPLPDDSKAIDRNPAKNNIPSGTPKLDGRRNYLGELMRLPFSPSTKHPPSHRLVK